MTDPTRILTRRGALKGIATGTVGAAIGGGALLLGTQPALASSLSIDDANQETTDDGSLQYVRVEIDHSVSWDGFDQDVEYIRYIDRIHIRPGDEDVTHILYDEVSGHLDDWSDDGDSDGWGGPGEHATGSGNAGEAHADLNWNVVGDPNASDPEAGGPRSVETPSHRLDLLEADTDGASMQSAITYEKDIRLLNGNENELAQDIISDDFTVDVLNEEATVDSEGTGNAEAVGENE